MTTNGTASDVWARIAEPVDAAAIQWRQDGKVTQRDGRYFSRFVAYIEANTVRERLDSVVPGEWDLTLELLPPLPVSDDSEDAACSFKARLQVLGVIREDVGTGRDYKAAATDAFKRAAVRFGIGHELYSYEQNWVEMDGDGRYAKPVEDPADAYARRMGWKQNGASPARQARPEGNGRAGERATNGDSPASRTESGSTTRGTADVPPCPVCGGRMWDNRETKKNPKAPDFKCRDRNCDGVIWPPKPARGAATATARTDAGPLVQDEDELPPPIDEVPF